MSLSNHPQAAANGRVWKRRFVLGPRGRHRHSLPLLSPFAASIFPEQLRRLHLLSRCGALCSTIEGWGPHKPRGLCAAAMHAPAREDLSIIGAAVDRQNTWPGMKSLVRSLKATVNQACLEVSSEPGRVLIRGAGPLRGPFDCCANQHTCQVFFNPVLASRL